MENEPPGSSTWVDEALIYLILKIRSQISILFVVTHRVSWKAITGESQAPFATNVCQKGTALLAAIVWNANPNKPDTGDDSKLSETVSHTAKTWFETENPAIWTTSEARFPAASPEPYVIWNEVVSFLKLDEVEAS